MNAAHCVVQASIAKAWAAMNAIFSAYFDDDRRPGRTTVGVTALARGGIVEIDMIAFRP